VAIGGKWGGTWLGARAASLDHESSSILGILMNTRGLMELVVLKIGLEQGILSRPVFSMMVLIYAGRVRHLHIHQTESTGFSRGPHGDPRLAVCGGWPGKPALLQPLGANPEPRAIEDQNFDSASLTDALTL